MIKHFKRWRARHGLAARFEIKLEDLWIGVFLETKVYRKVKTVHVWICFLPCFPLHVSWKACSKTNDARQLKLAEDSARHTAALGEQTNGKVG